jgi:hypothetical protein
MKIIDGLIEICCLGYKIVLNPLMPNDLQRHHAVSPLKIKIPSKNMHEKPTNATVIAFSLLSMCGISAMFRHYIAILREFS